MYAGTKVLLGTPKNDPAWVKETARQISILKEQKITKTEKNLLRELFFEYQRDGLKPKDALEKAKNVILCFKNRRTVDDIEDK